MKKILLLAAISASLFIVSCSDTKTTDNPTTKVTPEEFLASTEPSNRNAILEDFTGVRCGYCPDGHVRAKAAADANPGKFIIMAVHAGSYATPAAGWANFTTPYGTALVNQSSVAGFPAGTINRVLASDLGATPQKAGGICMSRGDWAKAGNAIIAKPSYVNIGSKATFDAATRVLTVKVDMYYTGDAPAANNINVALLQDHLFSKQSGGSPDGNNYEQNHVLRDFITGQWGEVVPEASTKMASKFTKTFTYTVPENYNGADTFKEGGGMVKIEDCEIVVFVAEGKTNIVTGIEVPITVK